MDTNNWPLAKLPYGLPEATVPDFVDLKPLAEYFRIALDNLQEDHFTKGAIWRDLFALTGSSRTFYTAQSIAAAWQATSQTHSPSRFVLEGEPRVIRMGTVGWVEISFSFETFGTPATIDYGFVSVVPESDGKWRIWLLRTILEQLKSQPSVDFLEPASNGAVATTNGTHGNGLVTTNGFGHPLENGQTNGHKESSDPEDFFECVIIGGGQAGLSVAGRLKALGVPYVILEKHAKVGDNWKTRYDSTKRVFSFPFSIENLELPS